MRLTLGLTYGERTPGLTYVERCMLPRLHGRDLSSPCNEHSAQALAHPMRSMAPPTHLAWLLRGRRGRCAHNVSYLFHGVCVEFSQRLRVRGTAPKRQECGQVRQQMAETPRQIAKNSQRVRTCCGTLRMAGWPAITRSTSLRDMQSSTRGVPAVYSLCTPSCLAKSLTAWQHQPSVIFGI